MGLLDRHSDDDDPEFLLREFPSVLLPTGTTAEEVAALVGTWSPDADTDGSGGEVAEGIRWYGPIELTDGLADAVLAPAGYAVGYVARCQRSRMLRTSRSRRLLRWAQRFTDSRLGLDPAVTEQADADLERDYPGGLPTGVEARAWDLVRGIARTLGGTAMLPDNPPYAPGGDDDPGAVVYAPTALSPEEALEALADLAPGLSEPQDEELSPTEGFWLLRSGDGEFVVLADRVDGDDRPPATRGLGDELTAYDATTGDPALEWTVAQRIAEVTGGVVLDEFGFRRAQGSPDA